MIISYIKKLIALYNKNANFSHHMSFFYTKILYDIRITDLLLLNVICKLIKKYNLLLRKIAENEVNKIIEIKIIFIENLNSQGKLWISNIIKVINENFLGSLPYILV